MLSGTQSALQNRVTPTGEIVSDPGRGLLMGNRGCLHNPDRTLGTARWRTRAWICCVLNWRDIKRDPMPPGRWTALFFLDEATSLAAGHRPCAYCRRQEFLAYAGAWRRAAGLAVRPRAAEMDAQLHAERLVPGTRRQQTRPALAGDLPDGVMIRYEGVVGLLAGGRLLPWSFGGYLSPVTLPVPAPVDLLTPPSSAAVLQAGYLPLLHPTAGAVHVVRLSLARARPVTSRAVRHPVVLNGSPGAGRPGLTDPRPVAPTPVPPQSRLSHPHH